MRTIFSVLGSVAGVPARLVRAVGDRAGLALVAAPVLFADLRPVLGSRFHLLMNSRLLFRVMVACAVAAIALPFLEVPLFAAAAGPWQTSVKALCNAFFGPIGAGLSLIAIVIGGLMFAFGEGGSKSQIAGLIFGAGLVTQAPAFLQWVGLVMNLDCSSDAGAF